MHLVGTLANRNQSTQRPTSVRKKTRGMHLRRHLAIRASWRQIKETTMPAVSRSYHPPINRAETVRSRPGLAHVCSATHSSSNWDDVQPRILPSQLWHLAHSHRSTFTVFTGSILEMRGDAIDLYMLYDDGEMTAMADLGSVGSDYLRNMLAAKFLTCPHTSPQSARQRNRNVRRIDRLMG